MRATRKRGMNVSSLKETIAEVISQHIALEDTYTYELKRAKAAFEVGTMSLEDFEVWTEENVDDLAKAIVEVLQPQLNENQKLLLEDLREIKESQKDKNMLGLIWVLGQRFTTKSNIKSFTDQEILQVLQALKQEAE
jgi:predicted nuclease of restriction endonuclease-like RecB superfamily|nr:MAG TPA: hypothetical protein [Caudoviricetes sp.]